VRRNSDRAGSRRALRRQRDRPPRAGGRGKAIVGPRQRDARDWAKA